MSSVQQNPTTSQPKVTKSFGNVISIVEDAVDKANFNAEDKLRLVKTMMSIWNIKGDLALGWQPPPSEMAEKRVISLLNAVGATGKQSTYGQPSTSGTQSDARTTPATQKKPFLPKGARSRMENPRSSTVAPQREKYQPSKPTEFKSPDLENQFKLLKLALERAKNEEREFTLASRAIPEQVRQRKTDALKAVHDFKTNPQHVKKPSQHQRPLGIPKWNTKKQRGRGPTPSVGAQAAAAPAAASNTHVREHMDQDTQE